MASVWAELKRRNVVKVAVAYAIVGWLLVQIADTFFTALQLPEWTVTLVAGLVILGFPLALILSWAYELTPDGVGRAKSVPVSESIAKITGRKLDFVIIGVLVLAVGFMLVDNYLPESGPFAGAEIDPASLEAPITAVEEVGELIPEVLPNSVAVLLCDNMSPNPDDAYFAAGIHEEILNQLFKIRALNVIARTSVMQYADAPPPISQIAEELNVGAVMECSVRFAGNSILVTAQLIDPETNSHLWSETYPGDLSDLGTVFAMQADIAMNIANALEAEFSLAEQERIEQIPTDSPAAYLLYLKARRFQAESWMADLDQAIELDPEFGLAYALRAFLFTFYQPGALKALVPIVKENAERALALDPTIGMAYGALAQVHLIEGNLAEAQAAFERAAELTPNDPYILSTYARFKRYVGEYDDAIRLNRRSVELDPNVPFSYAQLGFSYWNAHDYDAAATTFQRLIDLVPASVGGHLALGLAETSRGNYDVAVKELQLAEQLAPEGLPALRLAQAAFAYNRTGRTEDAERFFSMLEDLAREEPVAEAVWAMAYCAIADYDEAYRRLHEVVSNPSVRDQFPLTLFKANALGDPVLEEPRWQELRDRIGTLD